MNFRFELVSAKKRLYNQEVTYVATRYKNYIYYTYWVFINGPSFWSAPYVPMYPPGVVAIFSDVLSRDEAVPDELWDINARLQLDRC